MYQEIQSGQPTFHVFCFCQLKDCRQQERHSFVKWIADRAVRCYIVNGMSFYLVRSYTSSTANFTLRVKVSSPRFMRVDESHNTALTKCLVCNGGNTHNPKAKSFGNMITYLVTKASKNLSHLHDVSHV